MNKPAKKWLKTFCAVTLVIIIVLMVSCYVIDPFFAYRVRNNTYMISVSNSLPGIIKNYDYDTLIIGSSMVQNFKMDSFREKLNVNPAKIAIGGMVLNDLINLTSFSNKIGRAKTYYICLDLPRFLNDGKEDRVSTFLMDDNIFNDYKYLLGYSAWLRYIPLDLALVTAKKMGISLGSEMADKTNIDKIGYWGNQYKFGRDGVINHYKNPTYDVTKIKSDNYYEDIVENTELFINSLNFDGCEYNFFFPPYSILHWVYTDDKGYFEEMLQGKEYLIKKLKEKDCNVFDFQTADFVCELDNYKDMTHYSPDINEWMVDCFYEKSFLCNDKQIKHNNEKLIEMVEKFRKENADIIE